jgi:hypothetical protein
VCTRMYVYTYLVCMHVYVCIHVCVCTCMYAPEWLSWASTSNVIFSIYNSVSFPPTQFIPITSRCRQLHPALHVRPLPAFAYHCNVRAYATGGVIFFSVERQHLPRCVACKNSLRESPFDTLLAVSLAHRDRQGQPNLAR